MNPLTEAAPAASLYIAIPAYTGQVSVQTAHSLLASVPLLQKAGVTVRTDFMAGCCYLDHTRNLLVDRFLASDATDLLFIDADVGFTADAVLRAVLAKRPMIAGVYPKKSPGEPEWPLDFPGDWIDSDSDGLIEAAHVATGFLRISRPVFETLEVNGLAPGYFHKDGSDDRIIRRFFRCDMRNQVYWGEDYQFCEDWRSVGGKLFIIPDLDFEHVGTKTWRGNWGDWFRNQNRKEAAE